MINFLFCSFSLFQSNETEQNEITQGSSQRTHVRAMTGEWLKRRGELASTVTVAVWLLTNRHTNLPGENEAKKNCMAIKTPRRWTNSWWRHWRGIYSRSFCRRDDGGNDTLDVDDGEVTRHIPGKFASWVTFLEVGNMWANESIEFDFVCSFLARWPWHAKRQEHALFLVTISFSMSCTESLVFFFSFQVTFFDVL